MLPRRSARVGRRDEGQRSERGEDPCRPYDEDDSFQEGPSMAQHGQHASTLKAGAAPFVPRRNWYGQPPSDLTVSPSPRPYTEQFTGHTYQDMYGGLEDTYGVEYSDLTDAGEQMTGYGWQEEASEGIYEDSSQSFRTPTSTPFGQSRSNSINRTPNTESHADNVLDTRDLRHLNLETGDFEPQRQTARLVEEALGTEDPARVAASLQTWFLPPVRQRTAELQNPVSQTGSQFTCETRGCSRRFDTRSGML